MNPVHKLATAGIALAAAPAVLGADIDLRGIETLPIQDMDATVKTLEPLIGAKNAAAAREAGVFLE